MTNYSKGRDNNKVMVRKFSDFDDTELTKYLAVRDDDDLTDRI